MNDIVKNGFKSSKKIKYRATVPFFVSIFHVIVYYTIIPATLLIATLGVSVTGQTVWIIVVLLFWGLLYYIVATTQKILPGIRLFKDLIFDSFVISEIKYKDSIINRYYYFPKKERFFSWSKIEIVQEDFLQVYCHKREDNSLFILLSARYHGMKPGEAYTVVYGKYSKVLISILSDDGVETWDIPFESWFAKRNEIFSKLARHNSGSRKKKSTRKR